MNKPLSRKEALHVNRVLRLLSERKFTDAGRVLEKLELTMTESEWSKGYFHALQGMILALKSKDSHVYFNQINTEDSKTINDIKKKFVKQTQNVLHKDYDRGFFSAWSDYLKLFKNHTTQPKVSNTNSILKY
jgi:hypothetical protein